MMKYALLLMVLISGPAFNANAQDAYDGGTKVSRIRILAGLKAGVNLAKLNGDNWEGGYKAGLLGGAYLGVKGKHLGLQVEGIFSQGNYITSTTFYDGYRQFYNNIGDSVKEGNFRVNYLSIPVLVTLNLFRRVQLQLGPQYSGVVSVNDKDELLKDAKSLFHNGTVEGVGGLWLNVSRHLNAGVRYVVSFSDLNETNVKDKWDAHSLQLHIGYTF